MSLSKLFTWQIGSKDLKTEHLNYVSAASRLVLKAQRDTQPTVEKTRMAHRIFVGKCASLYSEDELQTAQHFLDAFLYKYQLANFSLEQLWAINEAKIEANLLEIIRNLIESLELSDSENFLQSHCFEQFLFQGRACLDFYMLYIAHLLRTGHEGSMSRDKFYKRLKNAEPNSLSDKAECVEHHFKTNIFGSGYNIDGLAQNNWGELLKSLRDKIAHKDKIKLSKNSLERIMNDILLDYPTIRDLTYERFCQKMHNGLWYMVKDLFPVLYDIEWQAGPYREGMFET